MYAGGRLSGFMKVVCVDSMACSSRGFMRVLKDVL